MQNLLTLAWALPICLFLISLIIPKRNEAFISLLAILGSIVHAIVLMVIGIGTMIHRQSILSTKVLTLYTSADFDFSIRLFWDYKTWVFGLLGAILFTLVASFSRYYMHRDGGFKRYFNNLIIFYTGYTFIVLSGNFETFFIGWEFIGICSFLLIGFYRDRYLPIKNSLKVISIFRLSDIFLLVALWACHHIFHSNISFTQIQEVTFVQEGSQHTSLYSLMLVFLILAAIIKSGQVPFSSWVPRAMEGPTSSSAVFYGSLSIHIGLFLLIRIMPLWQDQVWIKIILTVIGLVTALICSGIASVQSTIKTKIAYASITQIGIIFIEIAWGLMPLALVHIFANATLRTYQLLISPSVLNYFIHDMFFKDLPTAQLSKSSWRNAIYLLNIKEWNMDTFQYRWLWTPFKRLGIKIAPLWLVSAAGIFVLIAFINHFFMRNDFLTAFIPEIIMLVCLATILFAYSSRLHAGQTFLMVAVAQFLFVCGIGFNESVPVHRILLFTAAISMATIMGYLILRSMKTRIPMVLDRFWGLGYEYPNHALSFLICCLAIAGVPFTPTFLGIDLLFTHIQSNQIILLLLAALSFLFMEIALLRIYIRVFTGPHYIQDHPMAYRSS